MYSGMLYGTRLYTETEQTNNKVKGRRRQQTFHETTDVGLITSKRKNKDKILLLRTKFRVDFRFREVLQKGQEDSVEVIR